MNSLKYCFIFCLYFPLIAFGNVNALQRGINFQKPENIAHYYVSEKLDGVRALWDGQKLRTRNNNIIHAPSWFTKGWPATPLDGELWSQRGDFQGIVSCVRRLPNNQNKCWNNITFNVFDMPAEQSTFKVRYTKYFSLIKKINSTTLKAVPQEQFEDMKQVTVLLEQMVNKGAEGLMLHHQDSLYKQGRNANLMKYKKYHDAEATVIQHVAGKGKYTGKLGALLVELPNGQQFKIGTGFSDQDRNNPPPVGSIVTYRYIGTTNRGIPKFASYLRIRQSE